MANTASGRRPGNDAGRKLRRGRGRPAATEHSGDDLREFIIAAATEVYASHGYHGSTVEQILQASGVSRPTFYRHFKGRHDVLDAVIGRVNNVLKDIVISMTRDADSLESIVSSSIDAYFEWGERFGPLVRPIYHEIYDQRSPASAHRARILEELTALLRARMESLGRPTLHDSMYDVLLHVIEHVGHQAFWPQRESPSEIVARRRVIARILLASLALPDEVGQVPPLAGLVC